MKTKAIKLAAIVKYHRGRETLWVGTVAQLADAFGYTLERGHSWNTSIKRENEIKTVKSLVGNLNKSYRETMGSCYDPDFASDGSEYLTDEIKSAYLEQQERYSGTYTKVLGGGLIMANTFGISEKIYCQNGFYFGDPCYALDEALYHKWIEWGTEREKRDGRWCNDGKFCDDGREIMVVDSTAYGDGCYQGKHCVYGVDAGCLAVIPLEYCNRNGFEELGLVVKDFSGNVYFDTDGDSGQFNVEWGPDSEQVETGETEEDENEWED